VVKFYQITTTVCTVMSAEQEKVLKNALETKKKSSARVADIEDKLKNSKAVRERELKQAQKDVDQAKKRYDQSISKTKDKEQVSRDPSVTKIKDKLATSHFVCACKCFMQTL